MRSAHSMTVPSSLGNFRGCQTFWVHGPKAHSANARMAHNAIKASIRCPCRSILSMIAPQRLTDGRWCGLALAAVYVPTDKNSEFEAIKLSSDNVRI
jgi:hypothetical protein